MGARGDDQILANVRREIEDGTMKFDDDSTDVIKEVFDIVGTLQRQLKDRVSKIGKGGARLELANRVNHKRFDQMKRTYEIMAKENMGLKREIEDVKRTKTTEKGELEAAKQELERTKKELERTKEELARSKRRINNLRKVLDTDE